MADTSVTNSNQNLTEAEYKKLCKEVRQYQLKNGKSNTKSKPVLKPIGNTEAIDKKLFVQQNPVDWDDLPTGALFALEPSGVLLYTKAGATKALCLNTMSKLPVGGAVVHRVFL